MSIVIIHYEAKCKHCSNCITLSRKTYCTRDIPEPKTFGKVKGEGYRIRLKDKACKHFKL